MRIKRISFLMALVFLISAMSLPMTAFAAGSKDTTPPTAYGGAGRRNREELEDAGGAMTIPG